MRTVKVPLADRSYPIRIGSGLLAEIGEQCARLQLGKRCAVISDTNVAKRYRKKTLDSLKGQGFDPLFISLPAGEKSKTLKNVQACYGQLAKHRLERGSFIVALGGGVVGDLGGLCAATYLRGVGFVQVPTTLLAQVDSSVGGKVGVNLPEGKNLVGAFYQPKLVLCDLDVLKSLPTREFCAGLAEVIKYGIIYDAQFFERLEREVPNILRQDSKTVAAVVARCCQIKAEVVGHDEKESGVRAILNFGHTIGHGLETISKYGKYLHGEAISIGQVAAAKISHAVSGLPAIQVTRMKALFSQAGLPTEAKLTAAQTRRLFAAMKLDKKVSDGDVQFVLAKKIGQVVAGQKVPHKVIRKAL
ncbi:MAG: 3-dehydroquinate synthase [Verrucomicrobiota bacterium]|nr:3-dehydroquinate synthase [Verrucomicrobiota bacterium]